MKIFLKELEELNIRLSLEGENLKINYDTPNLSDGVIAKIKAHKSALVTYLQQEKANKNILPLPFRAAGYPLSSVQYRLWVTSQFVEGSLAHNVPVDMRLLGHYNIDNFQKAIDAVIDRHEILRTVFVTDTSGEVLQKVVSRETLNFKIEFQDLRAIKDIDRTIDDFMSRNMEQAFDLEKGPLLRMALLQLADEEYLFYYNIHHIINDSRSRDVLVNEVMIFYLHFEKNTPLQLPALKIQYKDYASWQLQQLDTEQYAAHKQYWLEQLGGELPLLQLPSQLLRPTIKTFNGQRLSYYLSPALTQQLKQFCSANRGSLFIGLLTGWNILLQRYTGQNDIIIGTAVGGREHLELEHQIGCYVNNLALRNTIDPSQSFKECFTTIRDNMLQAFAHQVYPFDRLIADLQVPRDTSRSPVFDIMLSLQNIGGQIGETESVFPAGQIKKLGKGIAKYDLDINFIEEGQQLFMELSFNSDIYEEKMMSQLMLHFQSLLTALLAAPTQEMYQLNMLSAQEEKQISKEFNNTAQDFPNEKTLLDLFAEQVKRHPQKCAIQFEEHQLTFRELDERSNQLAHFLINKYKIQREELIAVKLERSHQLIIAMLAILKSGAAYLPIDPNYPAQRIAFLLEDSQAKIIIDDNLLSDFSSQPMAEDFKLGNRITTAEQLAYVIYTSGSTGKPKGVMIEQASIVNTICAQIEAFNINADEICLQFANQSFDASISEIFTSLLAGSTLQIIDEASKRDTTAFVKFMQQYNVTCATLPPAFVQLINIADIKGLKTLVTAGEEAPLQVAKSFAKIGQYINAYGPTETSICATIFKGKTQQFTVPIGPPMANTRIYILDENQQLVPLGVEGELYVAGTGLARGYLRQPELTAEKFISIPGLAEERLYRTGDMARWLADGNIDFIGRRDDQVKLRGYRIELGEIQAQLNSHPQVEQALVVIAGDDKSEQRLFAYVSGASLNIDELSKFLSKQLPHYMVPQHFMSLEQLPLTPNGKVDKKALPKPNIGAVQKEYIAPRTEAEKLVAKIWTQVLRQERVGVNDNFYHLGGDSIKSIQVVTRIRQAGFALSVEDILRQPRLEALALLLKKAKRQIDQAPAKGKVALTPIQYHFFQNKNLPNKGHYNQSVLLTTEERLSPELLKKCLLELVNQHDALRMEYQESKGPWIQQYGESDGEHFSVDYFDVCQEKDESKAIEHAATELQKSINIKGGPLLKVGHFKTSSGDRLALIIHHLIVDGVSWRILLEDLAHLYTQYVQSKQPGLPLKTDSLQTWSAFLKEYAVGREMKKQKDYWEKVLTKEISALPRDLQNRNGQEKKMENISFKLDKEATKTLQSEIHQVYNTEVSDVLLTALQLALQEVMGVENMALLMEGHGREELSENIDVSRTVGWFTSIFPQVFPACQTQDPLANLIQVKETMRQIPAKGIGYGIIKHLGEGFSTDLEPEIVFNYLGDFGSTAGNEQNGIFKYGDQYIGPNSAVENTERALLTITGLLAAEELQLSIRYANELFFPESIAKLSTAFKVHLLTLINRLKTVDKIQLTPSDLTYKELSLTDLQSINEKGQVEDVLKLSPLQEGIYYHWLSASSSAEYFEQLSYGIQAEKLDIEQLQKAYFRLCDRFQVLRSSFSSRIGDFPVQIIYKKGIANFKYTSLDQFDNAEQQQAELAKIKKTDLAQGFDLEQVSQMRLQIVELSSGAYEFIWSHHHILMDGWCLSIIINEFYEIYSALREQRAPRLAPVKPYASYIHWLSKLDQTDSLDYWRNYLQGVDQISALPFKASGMRNESAGPAYESLHIGGRQYGQLTQLCKELDITQNTLFQGVWGYLLANYNNSQEVTFGAVVSGRPAELEGVEDMVGLFINTIPVRVNFAQENTVKTFLQKIQKEAIAGNAHHYVSLSDVQGQSSLGMDLINHIMVFENYPIQEALSATETQSTAAESNALNIKSVDVFEQTNYDFTIVIIPSANGSVEVKFKYKQGIYEAQEIQRVKNHFCEIIDQFIAQPAIPLVNTSYLTKEEEIQILEVFNDVSKDYPTDKTVLDYFTEQAIKNAESTAVVFKETRLTYGELDRLSNQLADYLARNYELKPEEIVALMLPKSEWSIISLLAILKSGAAYLPLDLDFPEKRLEYLKNDSEYRLCIDQAELDKFINEKDKYAEDGRITFSAPNNLAYVIYTSGTTGQPKGTSIEHAALVDYLLYVRELYPLGDQEKILLFSNLTFDPSLEQIFIALMNGLELHIAPKPLLLQPDKFADFLNINEITHLHCTPGFLQTIPYQHFPTLKRVIVGGERCPLQLAETWGKGYAFFNKYGPTETTIAAVVYQFNVETKELDTLPIGKPVGNSPVYIVNAQGALCGVGVPGELWIGGSQLGRGYLNRKELTATNFIKNPFVTGEDQRVYKTGDLVKWLADGNIEFIGRNDNQVKIRGYRIELGEIENALREHESIAAALVRSWKNKNGENELVAYIQSAMNLSELNIRDYLKAEIPTYMIPAYFIPVAEFPLTMNGKLDIQALPLPEAAQKSRAQEYIAPGNEIEERLAAIWQDILQVDQIGIHDNFFDLGGHSLKAVRTVAQMQKAFDVKVDIELMFQSPTIEAIAEIISHTLWNFSETTEEVEEYKI